ncbi:unnamed protein product [Clonostachys chloroleuca]|uniref:Enoyl reductase (ER) domain-containing protein n=1 Tax=Clonostachys chloroleuca TaxID=1926264 RepID=A0AA35VBF2_9HYPO|nr:unnamed protein product [Clonostachys chloroleuca]
MKEAIVWNRDHETTEVEIREAPIPEPGPGQVLIKVAVTGTNPKDWKVPVWIEKLNGSNAGDDIAGVVHAVGKDVFEFKPGDRVASFHEMMTPSGSFAEYAIGQANTTFHLPASVSFEEGATIPLAALTAVIALFVRLGLPEPWEQHRDADVSNGVIVYGGATAVGAFAIKLLQKANIHPIYTVAGKGADFVQGLIDPSKGDKVFDYRQGDEALVKELGAAVAGKQPKYALDGVSEHGSYLNIGKVLDPAGRITVVLPAQTTEDFPKTIDISRTSVGDAHKEAAKDLATAWSRLFAQGLQEGWFTPHPHEILPNGLEGLRQGLQNLRKGKASAVKYVARISETPGI